VKITTKYCIKVNQSRLGLEGAKSADPVFYDRGFCLNRPRNERSMQANLKSIGDIAALKLNLVTNHQTSFNPIDAQLTSATRYKSEPSSDLNCFFNEIKKGTDSCLLRHPSRALVLLK